MTYEPNKCIVKDSKKIKRLLNERFDKSELTNRKITMNAKLKGRTFTEQCLSRYRNHGNVKNTLATDDIMWLCEEYKIELTLIAKKVKK